MTKIIIPEEVIPTKIYLIREQKVMLDADLAELYQVDTKVLNQAVKRNIIRFPEDFMFQLSKEEWENLRSQNVTSSWGGRRNNPYAFTEHGVLMLSSVLKSNRAVAVNIHIMRVYKKMRDLISTHKDLLFKIDEIEKKVGEQDEKLLQVFAYLKQFVKEKTEERELIGFKPQKK